MCGFSLLLNRNIMKVLESEKFLKASNLTDFVNQKNISREDILMIVTSAEYWYTLFYYIEK